MVGPALLLADERSVSPVIGTVLVVTIAVLLSAMTAAFILALTDDPAPAPQTAFDFEYDGETDALTIRVDGGNEITSGNTGRLVVRIDGENGRA